MFWKNVDEYLTTHIYRIMSDVLYTERIFHHGYNIFNRSSGYFPILLMKHCRMTYNDVSAWLVKELQKLTSVFKSYGVPLNLINKG
jgi:hypothetical protein